MLALSEATSIPWVQDFLGVGYRYYDLRMNVFPLFPDKKQANKRWQDVINWWPDPSIKIRFVEIEDDSAADKAVQEMNGKELEGRAIVVNEARPREDRPSGDRDRR